MTAVIGIDVGTGGVRAVAVAEDGTLLGEASAPLTSVRRGPVHEQSPDEWWRALCAVTRQVAGAGNPVAVAVTSTSGTLVLADGDGSPVRAAIMYDDARSAAAGTPYGVNASHSLAKALWVRECEPAVWDRARWILHPADWLSGKLTGEFGAADYSNVLKLGYDPECGWRPDMPLPVERLPRVAKPGERAGAVNRRAAAATGLPAGTPVCFGATDGIASLIASGAHQTGDANTTLGTTLVWKALAASKPRLAHGIYCHLHPGGFWAPGAASNTGPGILRGPEAGTPESAADVLAEAHLPSPVAAYFLSGLGERFPFSNAAATGFAEGLPENPSARRAAQLQSLAFVERWGYELMESCGVPVGDTVYSAGGAAGSPVYSRLRAAVLKRRIALARHPSAAFGAAILAASGTWFGDDVCAAIRAMTGLAGVHEPGGEAEARYDELYARFRVACARRGYGE